MDIYLVIDKSKRSFLPAFGVIKEGKVKCYAFAIFDYQFGIVFSGRREFNFYKN